jgi:pimeloyl-ACP methyl ester carboxylesterase
MRNIFQESGGTGTDLLVMLHGLGATGAVWTPMRELSGTRWRGRWLVLDLPGHGASASLNTYAVGQCAANVGRAVLPHIDSGGRLVVLGHSFGGVVGLALASGWFGVAPDRVFGAGIKVAWSEDEVRRLEALSAQPPRMFATEDEAWERYLKVSGLSGVAQRGSAVIERGVKSEGAAWRLAMDPAANGVGKPPLSELMSVARCPIHLARGRDDLMVTLEQTMSLDPSAVDLGAYGHNVMVEAPEVVWDWIESLL